MSKLQFKQDCEQAENYIKSISKLINRRTQIANSNQSTNKINIKIRGEIEQLAVEIDHLRRIVEAEQDVQEKQRKGGLVDELEEQFNLVKSKQEIAVSNHQVVIQVPDLEDMEKTQIVNIQMKLMKQQDETLDTINGTLENMGKIAKNIKEEVTVQNEILDNTNQNVAQTTQKINGMTLKIQRILRIAPNGVYILTIVFLIGSLIAIIVGG